MTLSYRVIKGKVSHDVRTKTCYEIAGEKMTFEVYVKTFEVYVKTANAIEDDEIMDRLETQIESLLIHHDIILQNN